MGTYAVLCRVIKALYYDALNPLFRQIMSEDDLRAVLLAAFLHDVGQYPIAHDIEEADPFLSHEKLGNSILKGNHEGIADWIREPAGWGVPVEKVLSILEADVGALEGTLKDRILHSLIDGPLDADKLDYLTRDSQHTGVPSGAGFDLDWLLRCLTIVFRDQDGDTFAALGIHEKGKIPAEGVAFARYAMFGQVYWHHTNRAIKSMIHRMVWEMLDGPENEDMLGRLREEFRRFVLAAGEFVERQQTLFDDTTFAERGERYSPIQPEDLRVLDWLAGRGGENGRELYSLLTARRLFKRILVLARDKTQDKELWELLLNFYRTNRRSWPKKLRLQRNFQRNLVGKVEQSEGPALATITITPEARNKFLAEGRDKVLVLADFPPEKPGSKTPLEYVVEEDRRRYKVDEIQTGSLEKSLVWKELQENFHESIGKMRVFCHPDHSEFLSAYLTRLEIEAALNSPW